MDFSIRTLKFHTIKPSLWGMWCVCLFVLQRILVSMGHFQLVTYSLFIGY